jgi:hypothetical protein
MLTNADLDNQVVRLDRKASGGLPFKLFHEISDNAPKDWLIKGVFAKAETSAWIAPPGGMKSALLTSAAFSLARNEDWLGKKTKGAAGVVYFALERADLVNRRLKAHGGRLNLPAGTQLPIAVVDRMFDLMMPATVDLVVKTIQNAEAAFGIPVGLVIFDTFAKLIAAGGGDEDKARDHGKVFANIQRIKNATGVHVAMVGHTGKDETRGARGSNAILGDVDLMVTISGDNVRTVTVTKANDAPEGVLFSFTSEVHEFGFDEDGDPIVVNVVGALAEIKAQQEQAVRLTKNQQTMFSILHEAGADGLTGDTWHERTKAQGVGDKRKADLYDIRRALKGKGLVREYLDRWHVVQG